ncbi:MAG TPA: non-canonical purine NTP pyrophosphatase [Longimicrobiales bacterium]|nr:non-canonical purine NTP pyrophosphatase [Longimicrobiales bacterium]
MKLLVATRSRHKMEEIREILDGVPDLLVLSLDDAGIPPSSEEAELEPFQTFAENARSKARHFHAVSGLPTVADDSGLEVEALGGQPGVRSKRFAPDPGLHGTARDRANNQHLLERLHGVPPEGRGARYVCVAVLIDGDGPPLEFRGEAPGRILTAERGRGGFGYDPLFHDPELGTTFACIPREEKNARSHRGKAFRALADHLRQSGRAASA